MVRPYYYAEEEKRQPPRPPVLTAGRMTSAVRTLIILNVSIFIFQSIADSVLRHPAMPVGVFTALFGLSREFFLQGAFWQVFTYMFLHDTGLILHLAFNMMGLYFLGPEVERGAGTRHFLVIYFLSGVLGGLGWILLSGSLCIGASGAVMGVIGAFVALYPNERLTLIFLPFYSFKAWVLATAFITIEVLFMLLRPDSQIAHGVHIGGLVSGFLYSWLVLRSSPRRGRRPPPVPGSIPPVMSGEEMDRILDKISRYGLSALTPRERERLDRVSRSRRR